MLQAHLCSEADNLNSEGSSRTKQLNIFYSLKERNHFISRQVLYLGIAVLDKYTQKTSSAPSTESGTPRTMLIRAAAALWIAWKFLESEHIPLAKLVTKIEDNGNLKFEIIEMEVEILQAIDFQIPEDFTYASLVRAYKSLQNDVINQKAIVSQCLAFLKEGLQQSSDFSLCTELGTGILHLVQSRSVQDRRIKEVCAIIYSKRLKSKKNVNRGGQELLSS